MGADPLVPCILCGGTNFQTRFADRGIYESRNFEAAGRCGYQSRPEDCEIISCNQCGLIFRQSPPPTNIEARINPPSLKDFSLVEPVYCAPDRFVSQSIGIEELEEIGQFRSPPGSFLNVGGDCTDILETAKLSGWNSAAVAWLGEGSLQKDSAPFAAVAQSPRYDIVRLEGSLERAANPQVLLKKAGQAMRHDGLLVISTPDCRGWDFPLYGQGASLWPIDLPHWFFTPQTLKRLLIKSGFKVLRVSPFKLTYELSTDPFAADVSTRLLVQRSRHFRIFARRQQKRISDPLRRWELKSLPAEQQAMLEPA